MGTSLREALAQKLFELSNKGMYDDYLELVDLLVATVAHELDKHIADGIGFDRQVHNL